MSSYTKGKIGEKLAVKHLEENGYKIIEQNYRTNSGEIDIIAIDDDDTVVFIEVKTWSSLAEESLEYSIDMRKKKKILKVSMYFMAKNGSYEDKKLRYDVIFIDGNSGRLNHYENAFSGELL